MAAVVIRPFSMMSVTSTSPCRDEPHPEKVPSRHLSALPDESVGGAAGVAGGGGAGAGAGAGTAGAGVGVAAATGGDAGAVVGEAAPGAVPAGAAAADVIGTAAAGVLEAVSFARAGAGTVERLRASVTFGDRGAGAAAVSADVADSGVDTTPATGDGADAPGMIT